MSQVEFDIGGVSYRADRLDAFKQLHLTRKLAPMVPKLVPILDRLQKAFKAGKGVADDLSEFAEAAGPFADAFAALPDENVDYIVKTCLSVVRRQQGATWSPIMLGDALMFSDLDIGQMIPIVFRVIRENLGNFMQGLLANAPAASPAAPTA